ncbi:hypothetical protein NLJ89_g10451 [Agrocybe chaxingu]|uniref:Uncharacterized protein n=1 Tax=Agrocybe chaxingu TaxID=84603 RepID=A0A9W8JRR9_9AGAR|nr:hypothetical protein NLJ89_g10451 [Agrocybe chaxingu]
MPVMDDPEDAVIIATPRPKHDALFDECIAFQKQSHNIVVYSHIAGQIVTIAWPLSFQGRKIVPWNLVAWLAARNLHWPCFCGFVSPAGASLSCRIVHRALEPRRVLAFCHEDPPRCGFFLNLSQIYDTATLVSSYPHIVGRTDRQADSELLTAFALAQLSNSEIGPYFKGNLERTTIRRSHVHISQPRPVMNSSNVNSATGPLCVAGPSRRIEGGSIGESSKGKKRKLPEDNEDDLQEQLQVLYALEDGKGISKRELDGLIGKCDKCKSYFLTPFVDDHIHNCDGSIVL